MRSFQQNYSTLQKQSAFVLKAKQLLFKFYKRQFKLHALEWDIEISELNFIVTIFSYLQILSLPFTQYSQINQQYLVLQIIFYLSRPSAYVADQMDNNLNIICLTLSLVFIMLLLFLVVKFKSYNSVRKIVNYYFTYYNHYIFLILLEIGYLQLLPYANSSNQSTTNQNNSYYNQNSFPNSSPIQATFGTLLILLAQITSFYQLQFSDCCVNIFERGLSRITFTKENSLSQMLKHLIILILYMDFYDKHGGMTFVIISCIIYFILVAKDFEINIPYSDKIKIYANVIGLNMLFIGIIIGQILQCYFKLVSQKSFIVISILILPITSLCYLQYYNSKFIKIVMYSTLNGNQNQIEKQIRNQKQKKIHHFCLQLAFLTRYKKTLFQSKLYKFLIISMYELHSTYCIEATCFCKSISKIIGIQEGHFETNAQIVTFILNNICQNILTKESYITQNHVSCQFFILIKYMILQKKNLYSLQKVIKILSQKQQLQISLNVKIVRGFWFKAGLNVFLDDIRESMDQHFQQELDTKKEIYNTLQACNLFFEVEKIKQQNQAAVLDAIQLKIETLNRIKNGVDSIQIFKNINDEYQKFLGECEQKLTHFYEKIPTRDNQSLLCFFLSEIKSDLRKSSEIMQKRQFSKTIDMNLLLGSNTIMQIFSNSVYSLQIGYSKNFGEILWFSQQVPKLLGYSRQEFQYHKNLNQILPNIIAFYHDELVNDYLKAGENNKMLQELKQGYLLHDFGWIIPIQMFISINFIDLSQIGFFVFFQQARQPSQFDGQIIVSENNTIENVNYELLEKIGLEQFPTSQTLQGFDMYEIMGEFDRIQNEICSLDQIDNLYFQNIRINLPNLHYFKTQAEIHEKQQQQSNPSLRSLKSKRSSIKSLSSMMFRSFMIDFKIIKKQKSLQYKDVKYFILLIDKIIDLKKQNGSQSAIQTERDIDDIMSPDIPNIKIQKELNYMNAPQTSERDFFKKLNSKDYQNNDVFNINKNQIKSIFSQKSKKKSFAKRLTIKQPSIELEKMKTLQKNEDNEKKIQIPSKEVSESNTALQFKDEYENFENAGSMIEIESSIFKQLKELDQNKFGKANHGQKFQQSILEDLDSSFFNQKKYQISEDIESFRPSEGYPSKYDHQNKIYSQNLIDVSQISVIHKPESERNILQKSQIASDQSIQVSQQLIESYNLGKFSPQKRNFELKKLKTTNEKLFKSHSAMKGSEQVPILQQDEQLASFRMEQSWSLNQEEENDQQKNEMVENVELELIIENESDQNIENNQNQGSISIIDRYKQESTSVIIKEESESQFHTKTQFSHKSLRSQKSFKSQKTFRSRKTESNKQKYSSTNKIQNIDLTQTKRKANKTSTFVSTYQQKQHTIDTISNNQNKETKANNNDTLFNQENQAILPEIKLEQPDPNTNSQFFYEKAKIFSFLPIFPKNTKEIQYQMTCTDINNFLDQILTSFRQFNFSGLWISKKFL